MDRSTSFSSHGILQTQETYSENGRDTLYKLTFAAVIISAIVLMVSGWRAIEPVQLYTLPGWVNYFTLILVFIAFVLFVAAQVKTNIKRVLRHPQLTGLVFWCIGHLLANGDSR